MHQSKQKIKKIGLWLLPLIILLISVVFFYSRLGKNTEITPDATLNRTVPSFALPSLDNPKQLLTNKDLPTHPYLLNVWGSWCPSCKIEHPFFMQLAAQKYTIVGVNYSDTLDSAHAFLSKHGNPFKLNIFDENGSMVVDLGLRGAPESYIVDATGVIRLHKVGIVDPTSWKNKLQPCIALLKKLGKQVNTQTAKNDIAKTCV